MRIFDLLKRQSNNSKLAIFQGDEGISYKSLYEKTNCISHKIKKLFTSESMCAAIFLPNSINYVISYFAITSLNKTIVPIGHKVKHQEFNSTLSYCECDILITDSLRKQTVNEYLNNYTQKIFVFIIDTNEIIVYGEHNGFVKKTNELMCFRDDDEIAIMLHTSGTTSNPKRVMLSHSNLINNICSNIDSMNFTCNDKVLIALPMYFGYCNTAQFLTHIYLGASIVILDTIFLPSTFMEMVQKHKITNFTAVPSMLVMLDDYKYYDKYDYSSLKTINFGGSPIPLMRLSSLIEKYKSIEFLQTYGLTECSPRVTLYPRKCRVNKIGSIGLPIPQVKVKIVNELDYEVQKNEVGQLCVSGKNVMKGYFKNLTETQNIIKDNWLYTGDLGYIDDDGFIFLTGRKKNIIISSGINIYPEDIEEYLLTNDNIEDAFIYSKPDELLGEMVMAQIVLKKNAALTAVDIKKFCIKELEEYKIPHSFDIVDKIEKTYNGKKIRCIKEER